MRSLSSIRGYIPNLLLVLALGMFLYTALGMFRDEPPVYTSRPILPAVSKSTPLFHAKSDFQQLFRVSPFTLQNRDEERTTKITLLGKVTFGASKKILVKFAPELPAVLMVAGDEHQGWRLVAINEKDILLQRNNDNIRLSFAAITQSGTSKLTNETAGLKTIRQVEEIINDAISEK